MPIHSVVLNLPGHRQSQIQLAGNHEELSYFPVRSDNYKNFTGRLLYGLYATVCEQICCEGHSNEEREASCFRHHRSWDMFPTLAVDTRYELLRARKQIKSTCAFQRKYQDWREEKRKGETRRPTSNRTLSSGYFPAWSGSLTSHSCPDRHICHMNCLASFCLDTKFRHSRHIVRVSTE